MVSADVKLLCGENLKVLCSVSPEPMFRLNHISTGSIYHSESAEARMASRKGCKARICILSVFGSSPNAAKPQPKRTYDMHVR